MSGQHKIAWLCEALLVSRSGYYQWKERRAEPGPRQVESSFLRARIREEFARSRPSREIRRSPNFQQRIYEILVASGPNPQM